MDLALGGYSVFFDGFPIYVNAADKEKAELLIHQLLKSTQNNEVESGEVSPHLRRFFLCSLFSLILPVIMHIFGAYHLYLAFKKQERINNPMQFIVGLFFL